MAPNDRPANENGEPVREPGLFSTRKRAIESTLSLTGLAAGVAFMFAVLDAAHWATFGLVLGVSVVCMVIAALYRLVVHGRA